MARKKAQSKAENPKTPEPMDLAPMTSTSPPVPMSKRPTWGVKTLISELDALTEYEIPTEFSEPDGRGVAHAVSFDLTVADAADRDLLASLLGLVKTDARVAEVIEQDDIVLVRTRVNPRIQDSREPFGLADAYEILAAAYAGAEPDGEEAAEAAERVSGNGGSL